MKLTWYSPAGTEIVFSRDSENFRLLKRISGISKNPAKHITSRSPYQDITSRDDTLFQPREVSFDVRVQAPDLENAQIALRALTIALNPLAGPGTLIYEAQDGNQYYLTAIGNNNTPTVSDSDFVPTSQLVTIDLIAYDPFWYEYPDQIVYFGAGTPLKFPFTMPFTFPVGTGAQAVTNKGNVQTGVTIVTTGAITDPAFTREYTLPNGTKVTETMEFSHTFVAGDILTITTAPGNKAVILEHSDGTTENAFQYLVAGYSFWQLVPGGNTISRTYSAIDSATQTRVQFSSRYGGIS